MKKLRKGEVQQKEELSELATRCLRARDLGKKHYERHRNLLEEICQRGMKPGDSVPLNGAGKKAVLVDQFQAGKVHNPTIWKPTGVSRFDLEVIDSGR